MRLQSLQWAVFLFLSFFLASADHLVTASAEAVAPERVLLERDAESSE